MTTKTKDSFPIAYALKESLKNGYNFSAFRQDVIVGLIVSLVALPLAMGAVDCGGFATSARAFTAIVVGIVVTLLAPVP